MPPAPSHRLTRRGLLAAGGAAGLTAMLSGCGADGANPSGAGASSGSGAWSFTDDRKQRVAAVTRPQRVVAYVGSAAALHDFGISQQIVGVFGPTKLADGKADPLAGALDISKVVILGNAWGEFNVEQYAALRPELLITNMYEPNALWYVPDDSKDKIVALAPTVGLSVAKVTLDGLLGRYAELAASLGADLRSPTVVADKARYDKANETLKAAVAANPGIRVLAASASADLLYASEPSVYADLSHFTKLGVDVILPDKVTGGFFENLSWENVDKYKADLILLDSRTTALQPKDLTTKPGWAQLPAVRANQITPWLSEPRFSYAGCAPIVETLAAAVQKAKKVA